MLRCFINFLVFSLYDSHDNKFLLKYSSDIQKLGKRLKEKKVDGNYNGEGTILGGIIVYSKEKGVIYEYKEMTGSEIPKDDIINAIKEL